MSETPASPKDTSARPANRLGPTGFVLAFGVVSMLADIVYQGARSITGPFLATLGATGAFVGFITGLGEAVALVLRLATGPLADRTRAYWPLTMIGYAITVIAVPVMVFANALWQASVLVVVERFGKAVRTPARNAMLSHAGSSLGQGKAFAVHEALDQSGAFVGPLIVAAVVAVSGYQAGFGALAIPGALALVAVVWLRRTVPLPELYERPVPSREGVAHDAGPVALRLPRTFWLYSAFTAVAMLGFATFGVISYHLEVRQVLPAPLIPVSYAVAMAAAGLAALGSGILYDRIGIRGVVVALPVTAVVPFLSFTEDPVLVWIGAAVWGAALGIHESTLKAVVADLVPAGRRATAFGIFTAVYGVAWLAGSTVLGALYEVSVGAVAVFTVATQVLALVPLVPLLRRSRTIQGEST